MYVGWVYVFVQLKCMEGLNVRQGKESYCWNVTVVERAEEEKSQESNRRAMTLPHAAHAHGHARPQCACA
jgi:hypothetical protein